MSIPVDELFLLHGSIVVLTLLLVKIAKLSLAKFTGLYVVMVAVNAIIHELVKPGEYVVPVIVAGVAGLLLTVVLAGLMGSTMNSSNYSSLMTFVGLVPWYLSVQLTVTILIATIVSIALYSFVKQTRAFKAVGHERYVSINLAKKKMKPEEFEMFMKKANVVYAMPMLVAILLSNAFMVL